jgi:hypothetical protein
MKTTKLTRMIKGMSKIFAMVFFVALFSSCDMLESDPDIQKPTADITDQQIFARSNNSVLIDLNSKVQANQIVTLAVTSSTRHGDLTDLGKGLLQYSPNAGASRDAFTFTVYDQNMDIIKLDSVIIIIEDDSTNLPCSIYPANDFVNRNALHFTVSIDVLANDIFCGYDSTELKISIYQPDSISFVYPYAGTAKVLSNSEIEYTTGSTFSGHDKFIYKVQAKNDPAVFAFGIVYITGSSACDLQLNDDDYAFDLDSAGIDAGVFLPVFYNDVLCDSTTSGSYHYRISTSPQFGVASINSKGIQYNPDSVAIGQFRTDSLRYEVCNDAKCAKASVLISLKK